MGLFLPVVLILAGLLSNERIEPSVSDFIHTVSRDLFVGTMCAIGVFLISYSGYERQPGETFSDNWLLTVAGISAFTLALFPNESPTGEFSTLTQMAIAVNLSPLVHYTSALVLFYSLGHFCMFKFAKTKDAKRRRIYILCGWAIIFAGASIGVLSFSKNAGPEPLKSWVVDYNLVFWVEAFGIWAFAISWLIKGHADQSLLTKLRKQRTP